MLTIRELYRVGLGPSSSHTIGPYRAANFFLERYPDASSYQVTFYGSLALTGEGHGTFKTVSDIFSGREFALNLNKEKALKEHPNGMIFKAFDENKIEIISWKVLSIGGGELKDDGSLLPVSISPYHFNKMSDILQWCQKENSLLWEYIEFFEGKEIWRFLSDVWETMKTSIQEGLQKEGKLPGPLKVQRKAASYFAKSNNSRGSIRDSGLLSAFALAVSEQNASGCKIVTAPTCGACGVVPGMLYFLQQEHKLSDEKIIRSLATAGLIGNVVKTNGSISGAEVGCQGEIGTACSMAAAAAAQIMGGSPSQIEYAAEIAMEHNLGLTCDPVGGYVMIPCIERNAIAAGKAKECAVYALFSDGAHKVTFDTVVKTMTETGRDMQEAYRETGKGGLARTYRKL